MRTAWYRALVAAGCLALAGCGRCVYESRFVGTEGQLSVPAGNVTVRYVNMREYRDGGPISNFLTWSIEADGLASPPKTLTLRNASAAIVATLTISGSSTVSMTAYGGLDTSPGDARFGLLLSGDASVVLELENGSSITVPLRVTRSEDWHHPNCS